MAYIYQADIYCNDCGDAICQNLDQQGLTPDDPDDPDDEYSYDSNDYPKVAGDDDDDAIGDSGIGEWDSPQHCANGEHCINAITLPSGNKVGYLFGDLTSVGVNYVKEAIAEAEEGYGRKEVTDLWREYYRNKGYDV